MQPHSTFKELLEASILMEKESTPKNVGCTKAMVSSAEVPSISVGSMEAIQMQLDALNQYLKGANFQGTNAVGPFKPNNNPIQCFKCWGLRHHSCQCGSQNWIHNPADRGMQGNATGVATHWDGSLPQAAKTKPPQQNQ